MTHVALLLLVFQQTEAVVRPFYAQAWFWAILIIILFLYGFWRLTRFYSWLRKEHRSLELLRDKLNLLYEQQKTWSEEAGEAVLDSISEDSVQRRIVELAHTTRKRGAGFDAGVARELVDSEIARQTTAPRFVAGTLILFGLMGTLVGLSHTVGQLAIAAKVVRRNLDKSPPGQTKTNISSEEAVRNLLGPWEASMDNAATAFYASLTGVAGTVLFLLLLSGAQKRGAQFSGQVRSFVLTELSPFMALPETRQSFDRISSELGRHGESLRSLVERMAVEGEELERDSELAFTVLHKSDEREEKFLGKLETGIQKQQEAAAALQSFGRSMEALQQSCTQALELSRSTLDKFGDNLSGTQIQFAGLLQRAKEVLDAAVNTDRSAALVKSAGEQTRELQNLSVQMARLRDEYNQTQQTFRALKEGFEQHLQQKDAAAEALQQLPELAFWNSLDEKLGALPPAMANIQNGVADLSAASKDLSETLAGLSKPERNHTPLPEMYGNGHGDLKTLQVALVDAIEKGFNGRRPVVGDGVSSAPPGTVEDLQPMISLLKQSLDELLACNRSIHQIMDESHIFRSVGQRFRRFWRRMFGRKQEVAP